MRARGSSTALLCTCRTALSSPVEGWHCGARADVPGIRLRALRGGDVHLQRVRYRAYLLQRTVRAGARRLQRASRRRSVTSKPAGEHVRHALVSDDMRERQAQCARTEKKVTHHGCRSAAVAVTVPTLVAASMREVGRCPEQRVMSERSVAAMHRDVIFVLRRRHRLSRG